MRVLLEVVLAAVARALAVDQEPGVNRTLVVTATLLMIATLAITAWVGYRSISAEIYPPRHVLAAPMIVSGPGGVGVLPAGTSLVFEAGMSEGFDRFRVAVNVFGEPLPTAPSHLPYLVDPLAADREDATPLVGDEGLLDLLRALRVRRVDLERIEGRLE